MGGRGLRCRKSGSLGEPRSGRQDCSPGHGWGALVWGELKVAPNGSVGGLGSLGRTTWKSDRLGALCRRQPSPVVLGECSGTEEPGNKNRLHYYPQVPDTGTLEYVLNKPLPHSRPLDNHSVDPSLREHKNPYSYFRNPLYNRHRKA